MSVSKEVLLFLFLFSCLSFNILYTEVMSMNKQLRCIEDRDKVPHIFFL